MKLGNAKLRHMTRMGPSTSAQVDRRKAAMSTDMYPQSTKEIQERRAALAPQPLNAFLEFSRRTFAEGALSAKTKQLIAVAVAHVTQCPYCISGHTAAALRAGGSPEEIMEAIWVAAEMRAGAAYAHSTIALDAMRRHAERQP
jgi:AhpD family alkylhydroperoxidase